MLRRFYKWLWRPEPIPKIIWTYWDYPEIPEMILAAYDSWRRLNPAYRIITLNERNFHKYLHIQPIEKLEGDALRSGIMRCNGGFWIDADRILDRSLEWYQGQMPPLTRKGEIVRFEQGLLGARGP